MDGNRYLDLRDLSFGTTDTPAACCWWLSKDGKGIKDRSPDDYFLIALHPEAAMVPAPFTWFRAGRAVPLEKAALFCEGILKGQLAPHVPALLSAYRSERQDSVEDPFTIEARWFGNQFTTPHPQKGLTSFLEKNRQPWTVSPKTARTLSILLEWLRD